MDVGAAMQRVARDFPPRVHRPVLVKSDVADAPVFVVSVPADSFWTEEMLKNTFEAADGVGQVDIAGAPRRELQLTTRDWVSGSDGVSSTQIQELLYDSSHVGLVHTPDSLPLTFDARVASPLEIELLPGPVDGVPLGEFVDAELRNSTLRSRAVVDGRGAITVYVRRAGDANAVVLCAELRDIAGTIGESTIVYDYGRLVENALIEISISIGIGLVLVIVAAFLLSSRSEGGLGLALSIPFSVLASLAAVSVTGTTLDVMALAGIVMGIGISIDSGIVYLDSYVRRGRSVAAAWRSCKHALVMSTITTVVVFVPLIFASPLVLAQYRSLAVSFCACVVSSLLYVWFFLPALLAYRRKSKEASPDMEKHDDTTKPRLESLIGATASRIFVVIAIGLGLFSVFRLSGLPISEPRLEGDRQIQVVHEFPSGITQESIDARSAPVNARFLDDPRIGMLVTRYEGERVEYGLTPQEGIRRGDIVGLVDELQGFAPDSTLIVTDGFEERRWIPILIRGRDHDEVRSIATDLALRLSSAVGDGEIIRGFKESPESWDLVAEGGLLAQAGAGPSTLFGQVFQYLTEPVAFKIVLDDAERDARIMRGTEEQPGMGELLALPIELGNELAPAASFLRTEARRMPSSLSRRDLRATASLSVVVSLSAEREALRRVREVLSESTLPRGYSALVAPEYYQRQTQTTEIMWGVAIASSLVFLILLCYFQDLRRAVAAFFLIPMAMLVPALGYAIVGTRLSTSMLTGLVIIAGIAVNNGVLILDSLKGGAYNAEELALALRGKRRAMGAAAATTILGVIPVIVQSMMAESFLAPLTITISLGTLGAIVASYLFLPAFCRSPKS